MKYLAAAVFGLGLSILAGPAAIAVDDLPPGAFDWSGAYVGVQAGYGFGTSKHYTVDIPAATDSFGTSGIVGGANIGFNTQIQNIVLGLEADASLAGINGVTGNSSSWSCIDGCRTSINWFGTARARVGYAIGDTLPFLTGGLAVGNGRGYINSDSSYEGPGRQTKVGWVVGAGIEHAFSQKMSAKVEVLHVDLGHADLEDFGAYGVGRADLNFNVAQVGLEWHF